MLKEIQISKDEYVKMTSAISELKKQNKQLTIENKSLKQRVMILADVALEDE